MIDLNAILAAEGLSPEQIARIQAKTQAAPNADDRAAEATMEPISDGEGVLDNPESDGLADDGTEDQNQKTVMPITRERARLRPWQQRFIDELIRTNGNVGLAAAAGNLSQRSCERWKAADPAFREAWLAVMRLHVDEVEQTVIAGAKAGDLRAAEFVLKGRRREVYGDKIDMQVSGSVAHLHVTPEQLGAEVLRLMPLLAEKARAVGLRALPAPKAADSSSQK